MIFNEKIKDDIFKYIEYMEEANTDIGKYIQYLKDEFGKKVDYLSEDKAEKIFDILSEAQNEMISYNEKLGMEIDKLIKAKMK